MHTSIFHTDTGKGHPVVFLHGNLETHRIWNEFAITLSKSHRIITLDLPGFGNSPLPGNVFTLSDIASKIHDKLTELKVNRPVIVGHSLGGYITLAYAEKFESEVSAFGLFHSSALSDSEEKKENRTKLIQFIEKNGARPFIKTFIPSLFYEKRLQEMETFIEDLTAEALKTPARTIQEYSRAMRDRDDKTHLLKTFPRPIMMIIGENDNTVPNDKSIEQSKMIQRPYILKLKDTAHMGMFERPSETLHFVQGFLKACQ
jgi:pimeloyl-ACP methyl ester carboxylesterase